MSTCRTVCQHTTTVLSRSKRPSSTTSAGLWITDAQLEDAFARFLRVSQTQRRCQSNVPGPLEARKRETRRRRASYLNQVSAAGSGYSDAISLSFGVSGRQVEDRTGHRSQYQDPLLAKDACSESVHCRRTPSAAQQASQRSWNILDDAFGINTAQGSYENPSQGRIKHTARNLDRWWEPLAPPPGSLRWQPPTTSLPIDGFLPSQPFIPPPVPQPVLDELWEDVAIIEQNKSPASLLEQQSAMPTPVEVTRASHRVRELLTAIQDVMQVEQTHIRPILSLLLLPEHNQTGDALRLLLKWLKSRTMTLDAVAALNETVLAMVRGNTISRAVVRQYYFCLPRLTPWRTDTSARQALIDCYISLHNALTRSDMSEEDRISAQQALYVAGVDSMQPDYDACLLALDRMSALEEAGCVPYDAAFLPVVLGHILARVPESLTSEQSTHLQKAFNKSFDQSGYADTILQAASSYMKVYHKHMIRRPAHIAFLIRTLLASARLDTFRLADAETQQLWTIYDVLKYPPGVKHIAQLLLQTQAGRLSATSLARLLTAIEQQEAGEMIKPTTGPLKETEHANMRALNALLRIRNDESKHKLIALLRTLETHGIPVDASFEQLVSMLRSGRQNGKANTLAALLGAVRLRSAPETPQNVSKQQPVVSSTYSKAWKSYLASDHETVAAFAQRWYQIITTLPSHKGNNAVGVMLSKLEGKSLSRHDCDLLRELCSITAASATPETCRRSFRWIWQCYLFLLKKDQEPGSAVARAMFHTGVMIPLKNHTAVSRRRLVYLVDIIETTESFWIAADLRREVEDLHKSMLAGIVRRKQMQIDQGIVSRKTFVGTGYSIMRTKSKPRVRVRRRGLLTFLPALAGKPNELVKYTAR